MRPPPVTPTTLPQTCNCFLGAQVRTKDQAERLGIPLSTLDEKGALDVAIDGADDLDQDLNLVKGGGGALLREKMVEVCAKQFVVIVDESKMGSGLGPRFPIPVEITPFCHGHTMRKIAALPALKGCWPVLRLSSGAHEGDASHSAPPMVRHSLRRWAHCTLLPVCSSPSRVSQSRRPCQVTDNGNYIVDLHFDEPLSDPAAAGRELGGVVGVVEHGLFLGMADIVIVATDDGIVVKTR